MVLIIEIDKEDGKIKSIKEREEVKSSPLNSLLGGWIVLLISVSPFLLLSYALEGIIV